MANTQARDSFIPLDALDIDIMFENGYYQDDNGPIVLLIKSNSQSYFDGASAFITVKCIH